MKSNKKGSEGEDMWEAKLKVINSFCGVFPESEAVAEGACGKEVNIIDAFRCADCQAYFHRDCLNKHFGKSSVKEQRALFEMDEWEPIARDCAKEGRELQLVGLIFKLLETQFVKREAYREGQVKRLIEKLEEIEKHNGDHEAAHCDADNELLEFIGEKKVTEAFNGIEKWYA